MYKQLVKKLGNNITKIVIDCSVISDQEVRNNFAPSLRFIDMNISIKWYWGNWYILCSTRGMSNAIKKCLNIKISDRIAPRVKSIHKLVWIGPLWFDGINWFNTGKAENDIHCNIRLSVKDLNKACPAFDSYLVLDNKNSPILKTDIRIYSIIRESQSILRITNYN